MKPAFCSGGHVLVLASRHPPAKRMGSVRVMHELLSCYDESSFTVLTSSAAYPATPGWKGSLEGCEGRRIVRIMWNVPRFWRLNTAVRIVQIPLACLFALYWVARTRSRVIFAVYPEIEFLCVAAAVARITKLPLKLYMLDFVPYVEESSVRGFFYSLVKRHAIRAASGVATISDGLSNFYSRELHRPCAVIRHIVPPLSTCAEQRNEGNIFLGGGIYAINLQSSLRVARAALSLKKRMVYTSRYFSTQLNASGMASSLLCEKVYGADAEYQRALRNSDVLVLVLDWADESGFNPSALETIFPTRTMEYLQSGVPILVHCPASFFLARFFIEHGCGVVVSERSVDKLAHAIEELTADRHMRDRIIGQAQLTASIFAPENVSSVAKQFVES